MNAERLDNYTNGHNICSVCAKICAACVNKCERVGDVEECDSLLRGLRVFRLFKLVRYINEANSLVLAIYGARRKISIFFLVILTLAAIFGSLMYIIEVRKMESQVFHVVSIGPS